MLNWIARKTGVPKLIIVGTASLAILAAAGAYHLDARHDAYVAGEAAATAECNTTQLEEDLRLAEKRIAAANQRNATLAGELQSRQREITERDNFIRSLEGDLSQFDDGALSDRSRAFMTILSQRSAQYHDPDSE